MLQFLSSKRPSIGVSIAAGTVRDGTSRVSFQPAMALKNFGLLSIEVELQRERASALRWTGQKLEKMISELQRLEQEIVSLSGDARAAKIEAHTELRKRAEEERWKMIVQREAMGLTSHQVVDELYVIPKKLRVEH